MQSQTHENRGVTAAGVGRVIYAAALIANGLICLLQKDFAAIFDAVPKSLPAREALVYLSILVALAGGAALLHPRTALPAARVLTGYLLLWLLAFKVPILFRAPRAAESWESCGETAVILAGAWTLYAGLASTWDRTRLGFVNGGNGLRIARRLYGYSLVTFGLAHFAFAAETASLVPAWLPWHLELAYLTGAAYIGAGLAVLIGIYARLAAALSTLQMGLFTLLVWLPLIAAVMHGAFQWSETVLSFTLTASGWVLMDSYRRGTTLAAANRADRRARGGRS